MHRIVFALISVTLIFFSSSFSTHAQSTKEPVDRILVLAMDVSDSVNDVRYKLQIKGYAEAFRDAEIVRTITMGPQGSIAVTMAQWGGWGEYAQTVPWTVIRNARDAHQFADQIEQSLRTSMPATSISWAILRSAKLIDEAPYTAPRSVIDISGDGVDNTMDHVSLSIFMTHRRESVEAITKHMLKRSGADRLVPLPEARNTVCGAGIEINGLAIEGDEGVENLASYYRKHVICKRGSFVIQVENPDSYDEFSQAIIRKLRYELSF